MNSVKTQKMKSGNYSSVGAIEITTIPDVSILEEKYTPNGAVSRANIEQISNMLSELCSQNAVLSRKQDTKLSAELLWTTQRVEHQVYSAKVRMFVVIHSFSSQKESCEQECCNFLEYCSSILKNMMYGIEETSLHTLTNIGNSIKNESTVALVKERRIEPLNYNSLHTCLAFDKIENTSLGTEALASTLIHCPECAVSFQVLPTSYTPAEMQALGIAVQAFSELSDSGTSYNAGSSLMKNASRYADLYYSYEKNKNLPLFEFNIIIYGDKSGTSKIASSISAMFHDSPVNSTRFQVLELTKQIPPFSSNLLSSPWRNQNKTKELEGSLYSKRGPASPLSCFIALQRLSHIIFLEEAADLFVLPIGGNGIDGGFTINKSQVTIRQYDKNVIDTSDLPLGTVKSTGTNTIGITLNDLTKHLAVVGTPGSGKTTFSVGLLDRLWKDFGIPFLVIEPAKNEYRSLVSSIPDIQIFTPGKNHISPFVLNPFVPPKNVPLGTYKSTLKTAFSAAVSMSSPLDKIFEESINNCYSDFRWIDSYTTDNKGQIFNISDFIRCFQETFDEIGYSGDAKNIGRAGTVRLRSLINLFDNYYSIPIQDLMERPTIIELAAIENSEEKALLISLILLSILSYINSNYIGDGNLKNVILLEEAHVLMDGDSVGRNKDANPGEIARSLLKRMLAETRSYGVGIIVADQSPRKLTSDVIALTDIKVAFRIVESSDKHIVADSIGLSSTQENRLSARVK